MRALFSPAGWARSVKFVPAHMIWIVGTAVQCPRCGCYTPRADADDDECIVCERCVEVSDKFHARFFEAGDVPQVEKCLMDGSNNSVDSLCVESECHDEAAHVVMYDKLSGVAHLDCTPLLLLDNVWVLLVNQGKLSNCWVECPGGKMVKFGVRSCFLLFLGNYAHCLDSKCSSGISECLCRAGECKFAGARGFQQLREVQRKVVYDAPLGFIIIDLQRRKTFAINGSKCVSRCRLLSAIHFLLKHRDTSVGFMLQVGPEGDRRLSILNVGSKRRSVSNQLRVGRAMAISARFLDVICQMYPTVAFTRRQNKTPELIFED